MARQLGELRGRFACLRELLLLLLLWLLLLWLLLLLLLLLLLWLLWLLLLWLLLLWLLLLLLLLLWLLLWLRQRSSKPRCLSSPRCSWYFVTLHSLTCRLSGASRG